MSSATTTKPRANGANSHGANGIPAADLAQNTRIRPLNGRRSRDGHAPTARERLIDAATELVADSGYEAVTVRALCKEAGLSRQSFYSHFADKRALAAALHGPDVEEIDRRLRAAVAEQSPLAPLLAEALDQALAHIHASPSAPRARLIEAMIEIAGEHGLEAVTIPELAAKAQVNRGIFYRHFGDRTECLAQANAHCLERIGQALGEATDEAENPGERTRQQMAALCAHLARRPEEAQLVLVEAAALQGKGERLADLIAQEFARSFPEAPQATRRIAAGAATSLLRAELAASGAHGLADLAGDLTFAALGPLAGPELALAQTSGAVAQTSGAANGAPAHSANGATKSSTTGAKAPSQTTTTKEGTA